MLRVTRTAIPVVVAVVGAAGSASAQERLPSAGDPRAVPEHVLDSQRAGFVGRDGIRIDIGLEQVTSINGEIAYRSVLRALGPVDAGGALEPISVLTAITESGIESRLSQVDAGGWITAIQNTLDGQSIEHQVIMDLQLSNIPALRSDLGRAFERELADASSSF